MSRNDGKNSMWTERKLQNRAEKILKLLGPKVRGATLDIFLLPHGEMKKLKARFFKKKTEPNVLSFREPLYFPHPERGQGASSKELGKKRSYLSFPRKRESMLNEKKYLGEIYLNKDILKKSPERGAPLLLHGMLHLLGHDHKKKKEIEKMEEKERKILGALNG